MTARFAESFGREQNMSARDFYTEEEIRERQSISTLVFNGFRPLGEGTLEELKRHGIDRIELLESREQFDMGDRRSMQVIGRMLADCGIDVVAYHCHHTSFADVETEEQRQERVDLCRRQIDTMLELGGRLWGSHAGPADAVVAQSYADLARHVEDTEAIVAVENFASAGVQVEDRVAFLDEMDHPQVGMILDIGHVRDGAGANPMTQPGGPTRILELCGHRLRHLHLHGFKNGRDHHPPLVEGDGIQWVELFGMLRGVDYGGVFNFEPSGDPIHAGTLDYTARAPGRIVEMAAGAK